MSLNASLEALYSWLEVKKPGPHYCNLPRFYKKDNPQYFDEFNAFIKKPVLKKGVLHSEWHQKEGKRKEANDTRRYAIAALFHSIRIFMADLT